SPPSRRTASPRLQHPRRPRPPVPAPRGGPRAASGAPNRPRQGPPYLRLRRGTSGSGRAEDCGAGVGGLIGRVTSTLAPNEGYAPRTAPLIAAEVRVDEGNLWRAIQRAVCAFLSDLAALEVRSGEDEEAPTPGVREDAAP